MVDTLDRVENKLDKLIGNGTVELQGTDNFIGPLFKTMELEEDILDFYKKLIEDNKFCSQKGTYSINNLKIFIIDIIFAIAYLKKKKN